MLLVLAAMVLARPLPFHVVGNQLIDNDQPVRLQGVNVPSFEWSNSGEFVYRSVRVALEDWNANCIRLPLCEDRWFGKADGQKDKGKDYQDAVDEVVTLITQRKGYVVLDLHWSDTGDWGKNLAQHKMPDDNSLAFWKDVAKKYRGEPHVLFGLYNEPHDVDWKTWRDGGTITEDKLTYHSPGHQALLDAIRSQKAENVVVAGGLDWAYDLTGIRSGFALKDPKGRGVVYDAHIYPFKSEWENKVGLTADTVPILIGEVGCEPDPKLEAPATWAPKIFGFIDKRSLNWTAWCFHPTATPKLLQDWKYTPTPYWGQPVKAKLLAR